MLVPLLALSVPLPQAAPSRHLVQTLDDALHVVPGCCGRARPTTDLDGGGVPDLVVERGGSRRRPWEPLRIETVSVETGETLGVLWHLSERDDVGANPSSLLERQTWDCSGDANGDGTPDLVLGLWKARSGRARTGRVVVIDGSSGEPLLEVAGERAGDRFGWAVTFVGDLDADGRDDFAVGAPRARGSRVRREEWGPGPGLVSVRSGRDGSELLRIEDSALHAGFGMRVRPLPSSSTSAPPGLCIGPAARHGAEFKIYSFEERQLVAQTTSLGGYAVPAGDVDADGFDDVLLVRGGDLGKTNGSPRLRFGPHFEREIVFPAADSWSSFTRIEALGDVDGDGHADLILGEANFNLLGQVHLPDGEDPPVLRGMWVEEATLLHSTPRLGGNWESGCAWVYSGREGRIVSAILGEPGTIRGIGLEVGPFPDVTGDGLPDLLVGCEDAFYVFAGPGKAD